MRLAVTDPVTAEQLAAVSGLPIGQVRASLDELAAQGWIESAGDGRWYLTVPDQDPRS